MDPFCVKPAAVEFMCIRPSFVEPVAVDKSSAAFVGTAGFKLGRFSGVEILEFVFHTMFLYPFKIFCQILCITVGAYNIYYMNGQGLVT